MERIAILIASFNHREKLLQCLAAAFNQIAVLSSDKQYSFDVFVVDDASTDGSAEAVRDKFPQVNVTRNPEKAYWNRAQHQAWKIAGDGYDFYLWLRGDVVIRDNAFFKLLDTSSHLGHRAIVVGNVGNGGAVSYFGGRTLKGLHIIEPDRDIPVPCDVFDGSLVLIPSSVFKTIGMNDPYFRHDYGDYDYGARAMNAGLDSVIAPGILADTDHVIELPAWRDSSLTLAQRYRSTLGPKDRPFSEQFVYNSRSRNVFYAVYRFFRFSVRVLFPNKSKKTNGR